MYSALAGYTSRRDPAAGIAVGRRERSMGSKIKRFSARDHRISSVRPGSHERSRRTSAGTTTCPFVDRTVVCLSKFLTPVLLILLLGQTLCNRVVCQKRDARVVDGHRCGNARSTHGLLKRQGNPASLEVMWPNAPGPGNNQPSGCCGRYAYSGQVGHVFRKVLASQSDKCWPGVEGRSSLSEPVRSVVPEAARVDKTLRIDSPRMGT